MVEIFKCVICGKDVKKYRSQITAKDGGFRCSNKCCGKWLSIINKGRGRNRIEKTCQVCGKKFDVLPCQINAIRNCSKKCMGEWRSKNLRFEKAPNWKNGRMINKGYMFIFMPNHPFVNQKGYVLEHRLVMEKHLNRFLKPNEVVHHKNQNKSDNRVENLELFENHSKHLKAHNHRRHN